MSSKKTGLLMLALGILLPLVSFKVFSGYNPKQDLWHNIKKMELVIAKGETTSGPSRRKMGYKLYVPYRYVVIVGLVLVVWGAGKAVLGRD